MRRGPTPRSDRPMTRAIGGVLDLDALRLLHRPQTADELRVACHELRSRGLQRSRV